MSVTVIQAGLMTTIQDSGRYGYQRYGVSPSGVMDRYSYTVANKLLGNDNNAAVLETTFIGPKLRFDMDCVISITGADMEPVINDTPVNMWQTIKVSAGDELKLNTAKIGLRAYIAFAGGINTDVVMGSRSTYIKGMIGGIGGRAIKSGDVIPLSPVGSDKRQSVFNADLVKDYFESSTIRFIYGPQDGYFDKSELIGFTEEEYTITNECDRMGIRLEGRTITPRETSDIISDGISFGSIQIPSHGQPIVMMADRQTTGGYAKIGTVISSDLGLLAQKKPGDKIRFKAVDINQAQEELRNQIDCINDGIIDYSDLYAKSESYKMYNIKVNGKAYNVKVEPIL